MMVAPSPLCQFPARSTAVTGVLASERPQQAPARLPILYECGTRGRGSQRCLLGPRVGTDEPRCGLRAARTPVSRRRGLQQRARVVSQNPGGRRSAKRRHDGIRSPTSRPSCAGRRPRCLWTSNVTRAPAAASSSHRSGPSARRSPLRSCDRRRQSAWPSRQRDDRAPFGSSLGRPAASDRFGPRC